MNPRVSREYYLLLREMSKGLKRNKRNTYHRYSYIPIYQLMEGFHAGLLCLHLEVYQY